MMDMQPKTTLTGAEHWLGRFGVSVFLVILGLFAVIRIEGAVIATGQAVVQGKPRPVQSADGGVVDEIKVADGDVVVAGDVLVRLDPSLLHVNRDILQSRLAELTARQARLAAEARGADQMRPMQVDEMVDRATYLSYLRGQMTLLEARRAVQEGLRARTVERVAQYQSRAEGLTAQVAASQDKIALLEGEIANLERLRANNLAPESRFLDLQGRLATEIAARITLQADLASNQNAIRTAELELVQAESSFREEVTAELREVEADHKQTRLELLRVAQELARLEIRAPVGGIVHEMQVAATGRVLAPQETVLTVIPVADGIEFSLEIAPDAVDSVYTGQETRLRFPAFDLMTTPEIRGVVARVSPDSVIDPTTGRAFFRVAITVPAEELAKLGDRELVPGMPIEALLQTGSRSILSYLVRPLTDQIAHAFRES